MLSGVQHARRGRLGAVAALAALLFLLAVPPGVMVSGDTGGLVICTGHGPLELQAALPGRPGKAPDSAPRGACAFAGHAAAAVAPAAHAFPAIAIALQPAPVTPHADLAPGRGLAAPPPPSQGPPSLPA